MIVMHRGKGTLTCPPESCTSSPDTAADPQQFYLGSTKDIRGRTEYFCERGLRAEELIVQNRSDETLLGLVAKRDMSQYSAAVVEMAFYPATLKYLRERYPNLRLLVRSHNAEFRHRLHWLTGTLKYPQVTRSGWTARLFALQVRAVVYGLIRDRQCAATSDFILSISEWETQHYWRHLADRPKVKNLPYYLPTCYLTEPPAGPKQDVCVCLLSSGTTPFVLDAAQNLIRLVGKLGDRLPGWRFTVTGEYRRPAGLEIPSRVEVTGVLPSPFPVMAQARAMALLSDYGFGFKTKVVEAILHGCYVLVPRRLYQRMPPEIQPYCLTVDFKSVDSFIEALEASRKPLPEGDPNAALRERAFKVMDEVLAGV